MLRNGRRRYLALKLDAQATLNSREIMDAIWHALLKLYGEYGASRTPLNLIKHDVDGKIIILRTGHTTVETVRAALASITEVEGKPVSIYVLRVSGTIRTLRKKMKLES